MSGLVRISTLAAFAAFAGGCATTDDNPFANERRISYMRFAGVDVAEAIVPDGRGGAVDHGSWEDADGALRGILDIRVHGRGGTWHGSALQRPEAPVGTRYLDAAALDEWALDGRFYFGEGSDGLPYVGRAATRWMHVDLARAQIYITLDVQLAPEDDGAGPTYEGRIDAWGFMSMTCRLDSAAMVSATNAPEPAFCSRVKAQLATTPDDPGAPPPPFDNRDLISCTVGQPCEGLQPPAPWPGPPREGG